VQPDCRPSARYFPGGTTVNPGGLEYRATLIKDSADLAQHCGRALMNRELIKRLLGIAVGGLLIAGILFLGLQLFGENENKTNLIVGLFCVTLGNLFNIVRHYVK